MKHVAGCSECGRTLCPRITERCKPHFMGVCGGCHPEEHEDGFREIWWSRLETALISPSFETDPKGKYHTYFGMYNWVKKYDLENHSKRWELLEKQFDAAIPISFRSQSFVIQEMIRWVQNFDSSNHNREWDLLERWRNYAEQDGDQKQLQKVLLRMSRWVEENDSKNSEKLWELLTIRYTSGGPPFLLKLMEDLWAEKFPQDKDKLTQIIDFQIEKDESENDLKGQSLALQYLIDWLKENAPEEADKIWELLEKKLSVDERQNNLKGQSITLSWKISWLEENAPEDPQRVWDLLERKHEIESQYGEEIGENLGMTLQRMINWVEINAPEDPQRVWDLLERKHEFESHSGDSKSLGMTLQRMINWVEINAPEDPQRVWDILVEILSNSSDQGDSVSVSISLQGMVNWLKEHDSENMEMIWELVEEKIVNEFEKGENKGISMMLREMSKLLQEFKIKGKKKSRFDEYIREYLKRIENVGEILELSVSLGIAGESLPSDIYDRFDGNDSLHKFVERWCRIYDVGLSEGWKILPENSVIESKINFYKSKEMSNLYCISIDVSTPEINPSEIQDQAVLDLPNILGWNSNIRSRHSSNKDGEVVDGSEILEQILNEAKSEFGSTWVYLTPGTLSKYEEIVRSLIEHDEVEILLGYFDSNILNEDWCFISFGMIQGCHIVSRDKFAQEIKLKPQIEDYLDRAISGFKWQRGEENPFVIQRHTLRYVSAEDSGLSEEEASLTNLCMKLVYNHYGSDIWGRCIRKVSFDSEHTILEIHALDGQHSAGRIIGRQGKSVKALQKKLVDKFGIPIVVRVLLPTD